MIEDDTKLGLDACYLSSTDVMEAISSGYGQAMSLAKQAENAKQRIKQHRDSHADIFEKDLDL